AFIALHVQLQAGYFIATNKGQLMPATRVTILGLALDTQTCSFRIPEQKRREVMERISRALTTPAARCEIETLAGKLSALSMALPPLVACLKPMWAAIADLRRTGRALDQQAERQLAFALRVADQ